MTCPRCGSPSHRDCRARTPWGLIGLIVTAYLLLSTWALVGASEAIR